MKDKLLRDIELKLSLRYSAEERERIMQCIISSLNDYDVSQKTTDLTIRHEDINDRLLKRYVGCIREANRIEACCAHSSKTET